MKIQTFTPQDSRLSNSVECIYVIEQEDDSDAESFLILPSIFSYISVSLNTISRTENNYIIVSETSEKLLDSSIQFGLKSSCIFEYQGNIKEICIKFKPLGVYDFFDESVLREALNSGQMFTPDNDYEADMRRILNHADTAEMIEEIEKYLLGRYQSFSHPYLQKAVDGLQVADSEKNLTLEDLAKKLNITRQTLKTQFNKYLNLLPSEFRQICRFRKFVETKLINENDFRLTDFVYDVGFFDQSHLIKEFKKYTFLKPTDFFRKLDSSKDNHILVIWQ